MPRAAKLLQRPVALDALPVRWRGGTWALAWTEARRGLRAIPDYSVDLVFADPPYFLSDGGSTNSGGKRVAVDKGVWDRPTSLGADHKFHVQWLEQCQRVLKPSGTIMVSGTHHVIFSVGWAMQQAGWDVLNLITWCKPNATPNLGCRQFTHSTEQLLWAAPEPARPMRHRFNYAALKAANGGKQLRDYWELPATPQTEKRHGRHPTQKPLALLDRVLAATTVPGNMVLDPFNGSGTTGVAAVARSCFYLGLDLDAHALDLSRRRIAGGRPR